MDLAQLHKLAIERKNNFPVDATVIAKNSIDDPYRPIAKGTTGIVKRVDDIGTVFIQWETGVVLGAVLEDEIEILPKSN